MAAEAVCRLLVLLLIFPVFITCLPVQLESLLKQHQKVICNEKRVASSYSYNSIITGFTNISKSMHFNAEFKLSCDRFEKETGISYFTIDFQKVATKISNSKSSSDQNSRKRKMPQGFGASSEKISAETATISTSATTQTIEEPLIHVVDKTEHKNPAVEAKENVWYDMSRLPIKFSQHLNGTILEVFLKKEDQKAKSEIGNLKKSVALLFQTYRDQSADSVVETDDLGTHYSDYDYKISPKGDKIVVHKSVSPDDFLQLQHDRLNADKLEIFVSQFQRIRTSDWTTEIVSGRVATYPVESSTSSKSRNLPFSVEVTYALDLKEENLPAEAKPVGVDEFIRVPRVNFTTQEIDNTELLTKILHQKVETITKRKGGIASLINAVITTPHSAVKEANLLRSIIGLESKVFVLKSKTGDQRLLKQIFPVVVKRLRKEADEQRWDTVLKLLYVLSSGFGYDIDMLFVELLNDTDLMESSFRPQFLNTLIQFENPTDRLIEAMYQLLPSSESMSITEHHLSLAISSLIGKDASTITTPTRIKVMRWFQKMVTPLQKCPKSQDVYKIFLESIANFLTADITKNYGHPANELVDVLINVVKSCRTSELSVEALNALRNCLTLETVQVALAETMRADDTPCMIRGGLVDALVVAMELSSSMGISRSWPRYGTVPQVDGFILTEWLNAPEAVQAFECNKQPIARFLVKKKGRDWHKYLLTYLYQRGNFDHGDLLAIGQNASEPLVRSRRDDQGAMANPLAGLGGPGGLAGGFVFTPEVDCDHWDSNIGVNYTEIYENPVEFDNDIRYFNLQKRHCLFRAEFKATLLSGGIKAGFFAGRNDRGESKLFGRAWMGVRLLVQMEIAVVQFLREQTNKGFQGHVLLRALSNVYLHEVQYACNLTINDWTYGWQYTTPAFRVSFGGFAFLMNADFDIRFNLTLWPSFCGPDGAMGIRFRPITIVEADAYAELENDFFGLGSLATLYLNYYLDTQMSVPSGCFYLYHGNDDMFFKFDFYLKLPSFVFVNFEPSPVVLKQPFPVLTWQLMIKKSSRYILLGWCLPNTFEGPETPHWAIE